MKKNTYILIGLLAFSFCRSQSTRVLEKEKTPESAFENSVVEVNSDDKEMTDAERKLFDEESGYVFK